jgi:transposase-like protein
VTEYSVAFKANMVKKLMVPGGPTASALSARSGISQPTLSRWLRDAKDEGMSSQPKRPEKVPRRPGEWKSEEKLRIVVEAAGLEGDALGELLRSEGVHEADLAEWRRTVLSALSPVAKTQPGASIWPAATAPSSGKPLSGGPKTPAAPVLTSQAVSHAAAPINGDCTT